MNMILHGQRTAELWRGNTLADPYFKNPDDHDRSLRDAEGQPVL